MRGRPSFYDWSLLTRVCLGCPENGPQPLEDFYPDTGRPNGRTSRCKACKRAMLKTKRKGRKMAKRKRGPQELKELVLRAIRDGAMYQYEIKVSTKLSIDEVCDALADLHGENRLDRPALRRREYKLAA